MMKIPYLLKNKKNKIVFFIFLICFFYKFAFTDEMNDADMQDKYINDFARILTNTDKNTLSDRLKYLEEKKNVTFKVVIFDSIKENVTNIADFDAFAENYFLSSGLNDKSKDLMFIIFLKDRKMKVILGNYYNDFYQMAVDKVLKKEVIPEFKRNNYGRGIYNGTNKIINVILKDMNFFEYYKMPVIFSSLLIILFIFFIIMKNFVKKNKYAGDDRFGGGAYGSWA